MDWKDVSKKLQAPFPPADIHWRVGQAGSYNGKTWVKILAYIANRDVQNRLDDVVGCENWKNEYREGPKGGTICGIAIRNPDTQEWICKYDGAENTDIEAVKGGLSDAMKRAAVQWGIGRYLYDLGETYADVMEGNAKGEHRSKVKVDGRETVVSWNVPSKVKAMLSVGLESTKPELAKPSATPSTPQPKPEAKPAPKKSRATAQEKPGSKDSPQSGTPAKEKLTGVERLKDLALFMKSHGAENKVEAYDFLLLKCQGSVDANPTWAEIKADESINTDDIKSSITTWVKANHMEPQNVFATLSELAERGVGA